MNLIISPSLNFIHSSYNSDQLQLSGSVDDCLSPVKSSCSLFDQNPQDSTLTPDTKFYQRESLKSIETNFTEHWEENEQEAQSSFYYGQNSL